MRTQDKTLMQISSKHLHANVNEDTETIAPMQAICLRSDMAICFWECNACNSDRRFQVRADQPALWLGFILDGNSNTQVEGQGSIFRTAGMADIRYIPANTPITTTVSASVRHKWLDVVLSPSFLTIAAPEDWSALPKPIHQILSGEVCSMHGMHQSMTPDQFIAASQLMSCSYTDAARTLYLKSKTLELLAHMLADQPQTVTQAKLSSYDVACLSKARSILITNLAQPPSLKHLAAQIGLSETKLKSGFKALFGQPVFEFFRKHRVDVARQLLLDSDKPVSSVAHHIGYTNISHFSAAFKEFYGTTPSAYRRQNANNSLTDNRQSDRCG